MNDKERQAIQIKLLQQNLCSIRKIAGWTAEQLGEKIGVTKQTISNLENSKTPMTLTQYIAIRAILDYEMETNKDNTVLPQVVTILLDKGADLEEEQYSAVREAVNAVSASAAGGLTGATLATIFTSVLGTTVGIGALGAMGIALAPIVGIGGVVGAATVGTAHWLKKIIKK